MIPANEVNKPFVCAVFKNKCSGLESMQFGGALWVMLLRVKNKWILKETNGKNELDKEL